MKKHSVIWSLLLAATGLGLFSFADLNRASETEMPPAPLSSGVAPGPAALHYKLDPSQSRFMIHVSRSGVFKAFGHDHTVQIQDFSGEAVITPDLFNPASLQMTIKADSLAIIGEEKDRKEIEATMRTEVLETSTYPTITFKSTQAAAEKNSDGSWTAKIWGEINLHGVTGNGYLISQVTFSGNSLRAKGKFSLKQTDYKIKPVSVGGGTVKVKDELEFTFDIVAKL